MGDKKKETKKERRARKQEKRAKKRENKGLVAGGNTSSNTEVPKTDDQ